MATVHEYAKKVGSSGDKDATETYDAAHGKYKDNIQPESTVSSSGGTKLDPKPFTVSGTGTK